MRISVVTRFSILSSFILGLPADGVTQGGPRAAATVEHRVSVIVPVIVALIPPDPASPDRGWRVKTNDPILRRRLLTGVSLSRGLGETIQVTVVPP